jgi:hypothetical protein
VRVAESSLVVWADPRRLQSAILTLLEVAGRQVLNGPVRIDALPGPGNAWIHCSIVADPEGAALAGEASRLSPGREIELHYVRAVVEKHRGQLLELGATAEAGAGFRVMLPASGGAVVT